MSYMGLVPSEHTTGESRRQGAITKTGSGHGGGVLEATFQNTAFSVGDLQSHGAIHLS